MEPLRGGRLAQGIPPVVQAVWERAEARRSPAEWALRFVWDHPGVSMLLSGMGAMDQVRENLATAAEARPGSLTASERASIEEAAQAYRSRLVADCTECRYCLPCPSEVDIPRVLADINDASFYDDVNGIRELYHMRAFGRASACSECGECEELCPQGLPIRDLMKEAVHLFEE